MKIKSVSFVLVFISEILHNACSRENWRLDGNSTEIIRGPSYCTSYIFLLMCDMEIME